jgi:hypothetical protein
MKAPPVGRAACTLSLRTPKGEQDENNLQNRPKDTAETITPTLAMRPGGKLSSSATTSMARSARSRSSDLQDRLQLVEKRLLARTHPLAAKAKETALFGSIGSLFGNQGNHLFVGRDFFRGGFGP